MNLLTFLLLEGTVVLNYCLFSPAKFFWTILLCFPYFTYSLLLVIAPATSLQLPKEGGVMEWDFKDFAWDSNDDDQLDHHKEEDDLAALVGSSSTSSRGGESSFFNTVDLKLGSTSAEAVAPIIIRPSVLVSSSSSSSSSSPLSRNRRVDHHQKLKVSSLSASTCLVDGCKADLSRCREYHRRHRVCELHSKTPIVVIRDQHKRFCQQCSRFHSLMEFDEVKRSCRKRLSGHNQRRRKPKPEPF